MPVVEPMTRSSPAPPIRIGASSIGWTGAMMVGSTTIGAGLGGCGPLGMTRRPFSYIPAWNCGAADGVFGASSN